MSSRRVVSFRFVFRVSFKMGDTDGRRQDDDGRDDVTMLWGGRGW